MKIIDKGEHWKIKTAYKERNCMKVIDSPFCLKLYYCFETSKNYCVVYELLSGKFLGWDWPENKKLELE